VGAVDLRPTDRQPGLERAVQLGDAVEAAAGDHMVADDGDLPLDPALPGRPIRGQHVNAEPVMLGECGRLRMQRHRQPGGDMATDDGLGAVIDDRTRHPTEVGERPPMAIPERGQIHAGGETGERVA